MPLSTQTASELDAAVEVFVHGFSFMRSFKHPYLPKKIGNLWVLQDAPLTRAGKPVKDRRKDEVITHSQPVEEIMRQIKEVGLGWHFLCCISPLGEPTEPIRDEMKARGYRKIGTEWMFVHDLQDIRRYESDPPVRRVREMAEVEAIKAEKRRWPMRTEDLPHDDAPQRLYAALDDGRAYGWVSSIPVGKKAWVADLFVPARYRGRGFGRALMSRIVQEDPNYGIEQSVLMASAAGARLYPHVGYREIGTLQVFCPAGR